MEAESQGLCTLVVKWSRLEYVIELPPQQTLLDLKKRLQDLTKVPMERQKLTGLSFNGKPPSNEVTLQQLNLKPKHRIMLIGTPDEKLLAEPPLEELPEVINDLEYTSGDSELLHKDIENRKKLKQKIEEPRPGKKLLVLDLDYTLFDYKLLNSPNIEEAKRPYLDEFLATLWPFYDIAIWSQTSWKWVEIKLTELGMLMNINYQITFVDRTSMFTVTSMKNNEARTHEVKALEIIWAKFPDLYNSKNTIHIDDLSRNFALNPQNGLKIKPYKKAKQNMNTDTELFALCKYLLQIAELPDLSHLDHSKWKQAIGEK